MSINQLSCRMCLAQCSETTSPFWHYEHLINEYDDFIYIPDVLPCKICSDCCGNIARLVAFRDRIRSTEVQVNEVLTRLDLKLSCRICKTMCGRGDITASTIPFVLRLCSALDLIPNQDFWGKICWDCVEDLRALGYFTRKYKEVQTILKLKEFDFNHKNIDSKQDRSALLTKCRKMLAEFRLKTGDELCKQELSYLTSFCVPKRQNVVEKEIPIAASLFFGFESIEARSPVTIKSDIKLETVEEQKYQEDVPSFDQTFDAITKEEEVLNYQENDVIELVEEVDGLIEASAQKYVENDQIEYVQVLSSTCKKSLNPDSKAKLTDTQKFVCEKCGYSSHNLYKVKYHKRKHNKDLWLHCDICPDSRSFANKTYLINHMKRFHLPRQMISCIECGQQFKDHASRHYHHLSKHVDSSKWKFSCSVCGKKMYSKFHLKDHESIHTGETKKTF